MSEITVDKIDVELAIKKTLDWKMPGPDKVHNYWLKYFTSTHQHIANAFNTIIQKPNMLPRFLKHGNTYLKPKDSDKKSS